jgi:hypothetical protein
MRNDINLMSKKQLESYARKDLGIELDRRHNKVQLLARVKDLLDDQKSKYELEEVEVLVPPVTPKAADSSVDIEEMAAILKQENT